MVRHRSLPEKREIIWWAINVFFDKHYKAEVARLMQQGMTKEEAEAASPLMNEAREMLLKWESGDSEVRALWSMMNDWVYAGFDETYRKMGVTF